MFEGCQQKGIRMQSFLEALKKQRWDDHRYYHHSRINQSLHLVSALSFLAAYFTIFTNPVASALIGWLVAMVSRQVGHFFFEPKGYDAVNQATHEHKEDIKVGYNLQAQDRSSVHLGAVAAGSVAQPHPVRHISAAGKRRAIPASRRPAVAHAWLWRAAVPHGAIVLSAGRADRRSSGSPRSSPTRSTTSCSTTARRCTCCAAS